MGLHNNNMYVFVYGLNICMYIVRVAPNESVFAAGPIVEFDRNHLIFVIKLLNFHLFSN